MTSQSSVIFPSTGAIQDIQDSRDKGLDGSRLIAKSSQLPDTAIIDMAIPPIDNQGRLSSCVGWAGNIVREILVRRTAPDTQIRLSALFAYFEARKLGGYTNDTGAQLRDVFRAMANTGICPETAWPYDESKVLETPPSLSYQQALLAKIYIYRRLANTLEMRQTLSSGFALAVSVKVFAKLGLILMPLSNGVLEIPDDDTNPSGHAFCVIGYSSHSFLCRNSWGVEWGNNGYFWITEEYMNKYLMDSWMAEA